MCGCLPGLRPEVLEPSPQGPQPSQVFCPSRQKMAFSRVSPDRSENPVGLWVLKNGFQGNTSTELG